MLNVAKKVAVVDYGMGNLRSVTNAVMAAAQGAGVEVVWTQRPEEVMAAERVVLPGQGAIADCMRELHDSGMYPAVMHAAAHKPLMGVCVGMQMLLDRSAEGPTDGLGLIHGEVLRFEGRWRRRDGSIGWFDVGMNWVGAGNAVPSQAQLDLIGALKPTVFIGMSSFALHLANLAEAKGIDLAASSVKKVVCSAETLSQAKREKIGRMWGAQVYDVFGMSEAGLMGAETEAHDGIHIWTDMFSLEVVDTDTGKSVNEGEIGTLCVTPLWTNHATPFLRWNSGDMVRYIDKTDKGRGIWAELFPMIRHANRTTGFFKLRGVNMNHADFEDTMFSEPQVNDFQAVLLTEEKTGREGLKLLIEVKRGSDDATVRELVGALIKRTFEVTAEVEVLPLGTLAAEFERSIKAPRFVDKRI